MTLGIIEKLSFVREIDGLQQVSIIDLEQRDKILVLIQKLIYIYENVNGLSIGSQELAADRYHNLVNSLIQLKEEKP